MNIKKWGRRFLEDESGQTTTEYFLILAVVVTLCMQFRGRLVKVVTNLLKKIETQTDEIGDPSDASI